MIPRILKYELQASEQGTVLGKGKTFKPLSAGWQGGGAALVLWAEVGEPSDLLPAPKGIHVLAVRTGDEAPPAGYEYLGTASQGGPAVFGVPMVVHVYWCRLR